MLIVGIEIGPRIDGRIVAYFIEPGPFVCLGVKNIGKPCALVAHARFDEGGQVRACSLLYPLI